MSAWLNFAFEPAAPEPQQQRGERRGDGAEQQPVAHRLRVLRRAEWLPTIEDREYVRSLMHPVTEPGKIANWIAPPAQGIKGLPFEFEYVRL